MYYPIQIPHILSADYSKYISYSEIQIPDLYNFAIYAFEAYTTATEIPYIEEIILNQGTIDLGFDMDNKWIGFGGISQTDYNFRWDFPFHNFGIRLKPGTFYQLTGINANALMDEFLPLKDIDKDFDEEAFFALSFEDARDFLINYVKELASFHVPTRYTLLFDELAESPPNSTTELYELLNLSPRQCQRNFAKHYGITPKMVLTVLRFQKCLRLLLLKNTNTNRVLDDLNYYDQAHFTKDFKRHLGMTPRELVARYEKMTLVLY